MPKCILLLYVFFCSFGVGQLFASSKDVAGRADSLFAAKRYVDAYALYAVLQEAGTHTTQQLLRMAYIQEGLQHYPRALYHLVDYYFRTQDIRVWKKAVALSQVHDMTGYVLATWERFLLWLLSYRIWFFVGGSCLWLLCAFFCVGPLKRRVWHVVGLVGAAVFLLMLLEQGTWLPQRAVVVGASAALHEGPSGGAPVGLAVVPPGSLLHVQRSGRPWTKVHYKAHKGYIRTHLLGVLHNY